MTAMTDSTSTKKVRRRLPKFGVLFGGAFLITLLFLTVFADWLPFIRNADTKVRINGKLMSNYTLANFELSLREARRWVDDQSDELSHILTVYAWNEWHEGGIIEPSEAEGDARLAAVQAAFDL